MGCFDNHFFKLIYIFLKSQHQCEEKDVFRKGLRDIIHNNDGVIRQVYVMHI